MSNEKLRAFCEGLEVECIDKLLTGNVSDFKRVGEVMRMSIKDKIKEKQFVINEGAILNSKQQVQINELTEALKGSCSSMRIAHECSSMCHECVIGIALNKVENNG